MHTLRKSERVSWRWRRLFGTPGSLALICALLCVLAACGGSTSNLLPTPTVGQLQFTTINLKLPAAAYNAPVVGPLPGNTQLLLGVTFKVNPKALPTTGNGTQVTSGQDIDLSKYANQYGISDATYHKIEQYLGIEGVTLKLGKLHSYMSVKAKASSVAKLFQTQFIQHSLNKRTYYVPQTPPKLPSFVMNYVVSITGLETYSTLKPGLANSTAHASVNKADLLTSTSHLPTSPRRPAADCSPSGGVVPQDIADAYSYTTFYKQKYTGQHMVVNLVELGGVLSSDMENYFSCVNYPSSQLKLIDVDDPPTQASDEATLDIEMIAGLAPGATIVDYQSDGQTLGTLNDELQAIIDDNANNTGSGSVVSISYGAAEDMLDPNAIQAIDQSLQTLVKTEHMTVFVASGDCGAFISEDFHHLDVSYPASDPWATAVGGTVLSTSRNARGNETVWGQHPPSRQCQNQWGSGGGLSVYFKRPDWQTGVGVNNRYSNGYRQVPDIAAIAYDLPVYFDSQWVMVGGTSAATPIWASGMALVNQALIARKRSFVYSTGLFYAVANHAGNMVPFYDINSGNNQYYAATHGWDDASGWGSPNLVNFYNAILKVVYS